MDLKQIRMDLHQIPEMGLHEYKTKSYIMNIIKNTKAKIYEIGETGIVLFFDFKCEDSIAFRADMDALPIKEENNVPYKSKYEGMMHACGHDSHMTMLLGFIDYINKLEDYTHNIVCIFQPSEEQAGGAISIVESHILDDLKVKNVFGMHIWPGLAAGEFFTKPYGLMAHNGEVDVRVHGLSVHCADKELGIDALRVQAEYMLKLYELEQNITAPHLLHFGKFESGAIRNIVASEAIMNGTIRAFDDKTFNQLKDNLYIAKQTMELKYGVKIEISIRDIDYPLVYNDKSLVEKMSFAHILEKPYRQGEDFGLYCKLYPSVFFLFGCGNTAPLHSSTFDFNMDILESGVNGYIQILKIMK